MKIIEGLEFCDNAAPYVERLVAEVRRLLPGVDPVYKIKRSLCFALIPGKNGELTQGRFFQIESQTKHAVAQMVWGKVLPRPVINAATIDALIGELPACIHRARTRRRKLGKIEAQTTPSGILPQLRALAVSSADERQPQL